MNLEQAKAKLTDINRSTATKHPKVLIGELYHVIKFLLDEIEHIKDNDSTDDVIKDIRQPPDESRRDDSPIITLLPQRSDEKITHDPPQHPEWPPNTLPPPPEKPHIPTPRVLPGRRRFAHQRGGHDQQPRQQRPLYRQGQDRGQGPRPRQNRVAE